MFGTLKALFLPFQIASPGLRPAIRVQRTGGNPMVYPVTEGSLRPYLSDGRRLPPASDSSRLFPASDSATPVSSQQQFSSRQQVREAALEYGGCPDPFTDADALEEIEEEVVTLAAHIHAATRRLLALIAEFDCRRGWELGGHRSCAHWLAFRTGMDMGAAREKVRAARALEDLPEIGASMARGELSFSKVRALTRVANAENESDLLELARGTTAHQLERMVRAFRRGTREEEGERERRLHESRSFSVFPDEEGMYLVKGRLPAEAGAVLMRAVEAASDHLFREECELEGTVVEDGVAKPIRVAAATLRPVEESEKQAAQRRADALGLVAERALEAGFGDGPVSGSRAGRYQVMVHVDERTLQEDGSADRSHLDDGTRVAAETARRLACDCGVVRVERGADDKILNVGRRTRTIPPVLRRALEVRDQGCRFPGCGSRYCDAHHVRHWADGGETSLDNCLLLCRHHHRLVHEEGWTVEWWGPGRPAFRSPRGWIEFEGGWKEPGAGGGEPGRRKSGGMKDVSAATSERVGERPKTTAAAEEIVDLAAALVQANEALGVSPDGWTPSARWKREVDIPEEVRGRADECILERMA